MIRLLIQLSTLACLVGVCISWDVNPRSFNRQMDANRKLFDMTMNHASNDFAMRFPKDWHRELGKPTRRSSHSGDGSWRKDWLNHESDRWNGNAHATSGVPKLDDRFGLHISSLRPKHHTLLKKANYGRLKQSIEPTVRFATQLKPTSGVVGDGFERRDDQELKDGIVETKVVDTEVAETVEGDHAELPTSPDTPEKSSAVGDHNTKEKRAEQVKAAEAQKKSGKTLIYEKSRKIPGKKVYRLYSSVSTHKEPPSFERSRKAPRFSSGETFQPQRPAIAPQPLFHAVPAKRNATQSDAGVGSNSDQSGVNVVSTCSAVHCPNLCHGNLYKLDPLTGCETCGCCPQVECTLKCELGFEADESGCPVCKCLTK